MYYKTRGAEAARRGGSTFVTERRMRKTRAQARAYEKVNEKMMAKSQIKELLIQ